MNNNLIKKFLSFSYGSFLGLIIGFITTMITTRILQPEEFGKVSMFTLAINISMIFAIFGTDQAFVRFFYEEEKSKRGGLLYSCLKPVFYLTLFLLLTFLFFKKKLSLMLFGEYNSIVAAMLALGIVVQILYRYASLVIRMQQKGHLFSLIELLNRIFTFILIIMFYLIMGPTFEIVVYSTVFTFLFLTIYLIYNQKNIWSFKYYSENSLKHNNKEILKYSYPLVLTTLITWLFEAFDKIALRQWADFQELGLYSSAFKIVALLTIFQKVFATFWTPVAYESFENNPNNTMIYSNVSKIVTFLMSIVAIVTIMAKDLIVVLLGPEYQGASKILPFLVFMPLMYTISETTVLGINFYKKPKWHIVIAGVSCICNIIGNWVLVPQFGGLGAALSTAFSFLVFFMLRTHISLKYYKVNYGLGKLYTSIVIVTIVSSLATYNDRFLFNLFFGAICIIFLVFLYIKDIKIIYALKRS
ncbi:oligosaccharide flippase family protein [Peribacillus simplex]|uniref:lipopolysaccharide biosynthesis protein n=1 Tax=Peribacillus simplex TaxID=1478 RepID=UPI0025A0DFD7|nr:oligosaccharide flippase family protein [Peribacillus simplex]MDM5293760.1 oligosaccharide flippase family protein [Peribacillus simplex]